MNSTLVTKKNFWISRLKVEKCLKSLEQWKFRTISDYFFNLLLEVSTLKNWNKWWRYRNLQEQVRESCYRLILNFSHALKQKAHKKSMSKIYNTKNFTELNQSRQSSTLYDQSSWRCEILGVIHYGPTLSSCLHLTLAQECFVPRYRTTDHWIQESIKRICNSGLFWAIGAAEKKKTSKLP